MLNGHDSLPPRLTVPITRFTSRSSLQRLLCRADQELPERQGDGDASVSPPDGQGAACGWGLRTRLGPGLKEGTLHPRRPSPEAPSPVGEARGEAPWCTHCWDVVLGLRVEGRSPWVGVVASEPSLATDDGECLGCGPHAQCPVGVGAPKGFILEEAPCPFEGGPRAKGEVCRATGWALGWQGGDHGEERQGRLDPAMSAAHPVRWRLPGQVCTGLPGGEGLGQGLLRFLPLQAPPAPHGVLSHRCE